MKAYLLKFTCGLALLGAVVVSHAQSTVANYTFNGNINDSSGYGNNLQVAAGSISYVSGLFGQEALSLDGSTYLTTASGLFPSGVPTSNSSYTVAAYIYNTGGSTTGGWVGYGANVNSGGNNFRLNNDSVWNYWYANDMGASLPSGSFYQSWNSVVGTWDGTTENLYLNGALISSRQPAVSINVQPDLFFVGRTTSDDNFTGYIQNLTIANYAFTPAEVAAYNTIGAAAPAPEPATLALVGLGGMGMIWHLRRRK